MANATQSQRIWSAQRTLLGYSWLAALVLAAALLAAYGSALRHPFLLDDLNDIVDNPSIRHLWPLSELFIIRTGDTVGLNSRPVAVLSFAVDYAVAGTANTLVYHATNLAVHILAALILFGLVRRTLLLPALQPRFGAAALPIALAVALVWSLHPLQTSAVTYVVQRYESLMGLFYLLAVYALVRDADSAHPRRWGVVTVLAALLSMGSKEVGVSIPLVVLLYDRTFLSGSFGEAWRRRLGMYLSLLGAWLAFGLVQALTPPREFAGVGQMVTHRWWEYAYSQPGVILHYLRLVFWPHPLVLDYWWPLARTWSEILPGALVVGGLVAATAWALVYRPGWGFLGAWFFLILAPTSSVMPLADLAFEHRMYLPLAAVVTAVVLAAYLLGKNLLESHTAVARLSGWALVLTVAAALATRTVLRNADYRTVEGLWRDNVAWRPLNPRARYNLGTTLAARGVVDEAIGHYRKALEIKPDYADAHDNLGFSLVLRGQFDEAIAHYRKALEIKPDFALAHTNLGVALASRGQFDEAATHYKKTLESEPDFALAHNNLAGILARRGQVDEAIAHYQRALETKPDAAEVHYNLGFTLAGGGRLDEAIGHYRKALELKPDYAEAHYNLGLALARGGRLDEAIVHYRQALELKPDYAEAHNNLGNVLARRGQFDAAIAHYRQALEIKPDSAEVHYNLGLALELQGNTRDAILHWRIVARAQPNSPPILSRLAWVLATSPDETIRNGQEALELADRAVRLSGGRDPRLLDALAAAYAETGDFSRATQIATQALAQAQAQNNQLLADALRQRISRYRAGVPHREPGNGD